MQHQRMVPFKIVSMDSLGQGVSKETDKITFIFKTLPGDEGQARVTSAKKGVQFCKLTQLEKPSPLRTEPECKHFNNCPSCHYLHTPYEQELLFKKESLKNMFYKTALPEIKVTPAVRRTHYRNRMQLHYHKGKKLLGMLDAKDQTIAPIPDCLIGVEGILNEVKNLYQNQNWLKAAQHQPEQGHVEIYALDGQIKISWNQNYAHGGFTQVFNEMNQLLKAELNSWSKKDPSFELLDLFAGNGNLSENMNYSKRLCSDIYQNKISQDFFSQDLYAPEAVKNVKQKLSQIGMKPEILLVDPPRSGVKNLHEWVAELKPLKIIYVSCDPHTLVRDISSLIDYKISDLQLFDFFPSTFHFETVAFLEKK